VLQGTFQPQGHAGVGRNGGVPGFSGLGLKVGGGWSRFRRWPSDWSLGQEAYATQSRDPASSKEQAPGGGGGGPISSCFDCRERWSAQMGPALNAHARNGFEAAARAAEEQLALTFKWRPTPQQIKEKRARFNNGRSRGASRTHERFVSDVIDDRTRPPTAAGGRAAREA